MPRPYRFFGAGDPFSMGQYEKPTPERRRGDLGVRLNKMGSRLVPKVPFENRLKNHTFAKNKP